MDYMSSRWLYLMSLVLLIVLFAVIKSVGSFVIPMIKDGFIQNEVLKKGMVANAYIITANQTTIWSGNRPVYRLTLKFQTYQKQKVEASLKKELTFDEIERFKPGNVVTIKYDPKDPQRIAIYDKPIING